MIPVSLTPSHTSGLLHTTHTQTQTHIQSFINSMIQAQQLSWCAHYLHFKTTTFEWNNLWPRYLACWFILILSRSSSKVNIISKHWRSQEAKFCQSGWCELDWVLSSFSTSSGLVGNHQQNLRKALETTVELKTIVELTELWFYVPLHTK